MNTTTRPSATATLAPLSDERVLAPATAPPDPHDVDARERGGRPGRIRRARRAEVPALDTAVPAGRTPRFGRRVPPGVLLVFSRQLASFLEAGVPVIEALEVVGSETTSERMRQVVADMRDTVLRGGSFSDATGHHTAVFPGWYRAMVRSAERTGRMDDVLEQLASYIERDVAAKRQVKGALTYPAFVLVVAAIGMVVMSMFVLPKFDAMYRDLGARLPLPTRILLGWTGFVGATWPVIAGLLVVSGLAARALLGGERGKPRRDRLALRTPVVGGIYHMICVERFCRVLAALTAAGVGLPEGIEMSGRSTNNTVFQNRLEPVREALLRGGGLSRPMAESGVIPIAALQMIRVGERTGTLAVQLAKSATFFEREVAHRIRRATDLFQPAVIVFVGGVVGFVAVAQVAAMYSVFGQVNP